MKTGAVIAQQFILKEELISYKIIGIPFYVGLIAFEQARSPYSAEVNYE
jgi:hypothetical protein